MTAGAKKEPRGATTRGGGVEPQKNGSRNISYYDGGFKRTSPDIGRLERALVGAAICHVNEAILLKDRGVHPGHLEDTKLQEILRAAYALEPAGLMETAEETAAALLDHLHHRGVNVTAYDLGKVADGAAWPGAHFERIYAAWRQAHQVRRQAALLQDLAERARSGETLDPADIADSLGACHE